MDAPRPIVLAFGGLDPTGGAGLAADVLVLTSLGAHGAPVATAITAQDTIGIKAWRGVETEMITAQARAVLEDMPVAAIKIGMIGEAAAAAAIHAVLSDYPRIPVIYDPVLASGKGDSLADASLAEALIALILPRTTLLTPNTHEAARLAPEADSPDARAQAIMSLGVRYVLLTGTHDPTPTVHHRLFGDHRKLEDFENERLPHDYHGSGCTLAAACAAGIAHGLDVPSATAQALRYTFNSLKRAFRPGLGQFLPDRCWYGTRQ